MQKKRGISLIVLVITIIVMIILAAAIILSLNNAGIIGNANKAVNETNIANIKSAADLAYAEYLLDKPEGVTDLGVYLTDQLVAKGTIEGRDKDYYIEMYDDETVVVKVGTTADKYYKEEIKRGDTINYVASGTGYENYNWRILGIDKNNQLLIVPEEFDADLSLTKEDYGNMIERLHSECEKYGNGKWAVGARSITVEDINRATGYDIYSDTSRNGTIGEYENIVTVYWDGSDKPYYTASNDIDGYLSSHTEFTWYDEAKGWQTSTRSTTATKEKMEKICTLKITYWGGCSWYDTPFEEESNEELMIFGTCFSRAFGDWADLYWVANKSVYELSGKIIYGFYYVGNGRVSCNSFTATQRYSLKPVVTLERDIVVTGSTTDGWTIVE